MATATSPVPRLLQKYNEEIVGGLSKKFGRVNRLSLPKLTKIVLNMGVGKALQDKERMKVAAEQLGLIAGQKAQITKSRVAVSGFRLRENSEIGCRVTLRGKRMYEFLDRLINLALPRIRDFRGVNPKSFDGNGNYSMGLTEQLVFPEIDPDKVTFTQGMDITFVTTTKNDDEARELLRSFGMPFRDSLPVVVPDKRVTPNARGPATSEPALVPGKRDVSALLVNANGLDAELFQIDCDALDKRISPADAEVRVNKVRSQAELLNKEAFGLVRSVVGRVVARADKLLDLRQRGLWPAEVPKLEQHERIPKDSVRSIWGTVLDCNGPLFVNSHYTFKVVISAPAKGREESGWKNRTFLAVEAILTGPDFGVQPVRREGQLLATAESVFEFDLVPRARGRQLLVFTLISDATAEVIRVADWELEVAESARATVIG